METEKTQQYINEQNRLLNPRGYHVIKMKDKQYYLFIFSTFIITLLITGVLGTLIYKDHFKTELSIEGSNLTNNCLIPACPSCPSIPNCPDVIFEKGVCDSPLDLKINITINNGSL